MHNVLEVMEEVVQHSALRENGSGLKAEREPWVYLFGNIFRKQTNHSNLDVLMASGILNRVLLFQRERCNLKK